MMLSDLDVTKVFTAQNGREALDFLDAVAQPIDVIICDWNMPRMTGIELLQQVRKFDQEAPFILLTGRADTDSAASARDFGVTGFLLKPFTLVQLEETLSPVAKRGNALMA